MAVCEWCGEEMLSPLVASCRENTVIAFPDGAELPAVRYGSDAVEATGDDPHAHRCHDCNIQVGGFHHPGCDMEQCPRCGGQLITCGCLEDGSEDDDSEDDG